MISFVIDQSIPGVFYLPKKWWISWNCALFIKNYLFFKDSILLPCKKFKPQIWALSKLHFWNFYRPLPCEPPFERRIRRAAAVRAAQRTRRNNCFYHAYIEIYVFPPNLIFVNSIFSANQFLIRILSCAALWKTNATANNIMRRATPQCM